MLILLSHRDGSVRRDAFAHSTKEARQAREGYPQEMSDHDHPDHRDIRWVDRGMGETYSQITRNSVALAGKRTTARLWVIAPDPELMEHIPEDQRMAVLRRTTEQTLAYWYDDNGWGQPEYSYVLHDKERNQDNKQMLHTHVVTPGTYDPGDGLGRLDQYVRKPHIKNLHEISGEVFQGEMERVLGRERTTQIIHERDERNLDKKYPDRHQRQDRAEAAERRSKMQQVHDVQSIMKREQERKKRQKEGREKSREEERRERAEDMRMYAHYHQRREQQARQQNHADRQAEW